MSINTIYFSWWWNKIIWYNTSKFNIALGVRGLKAKQWKSPTSNTKPLNRVSEIRYTYLEGMNLNIWVAVRIYKYRTWAWAKWLTPYKSVDLNCAPSLAIQTTEPSGEIHNLLLCLQNWTLYTKYRHRSTISILAYRLQINKWFH